MNNNQLVYKANMVCRLNEKNTTCFLGCDDFGGKWDYYVKISGIQNGDKSKATAHIFKNNEEDTTHIPLSDEFPLKFPDTFKISDLKEYAEKHYI